MPGLLKSARNGIAPIRVQIRGIVNRCVSGRPFNGQFVWPFPDESSCPGQTRNPTRPLVRLTDGRRRAVRHRRPAPPGGTPGN